MTRGARAAVVLVAASGIALGDPPASDLAVDAPGPVAVIDVPAGSAATATLTLRDVGTNALALTSIDRDGCDAGITLAPSPDDLPASIAAGGTHDAVATCPATDASTIRRCRFHARAAPAQADVTVLCVGTGTSVLGAAPGSLAFGDVPIGGSVTLPLTITNTTGAAVEALAIHVADQNGDFRVGSPCQQDVAGCSAPFAIAAGDSRVVQVKCTPSQTGALASKLFVVSDDGGRAAAIDLACNGVAGSAGPQLTLDAPLVDVEGVAVAGDATGTGALRVTNTGGSDLHVSSIARAGGFANEWTFAATGACASPPCTLAPGTGFDLAVALDPGGIGARNTTLQIVSDDALHPTTSIPLHGTGRAATLGFDGPVPAALDLGDVAVGGSAQLSFGLRNDGNTALVAGAIAVDPPDGFALGTATLDLAPSAILPVTVTCTPAAEGTLTATITATADDALTGSPLAIPVTCRGVTGDLVAAPSPIALGEVRQGTGVHDLPIGLTSLSGDPLDLTGAPALDTAISGMTVGAPSDSQTPATFTLSVDPQSDLDLANHITVAAGASSLDIPVTGRVVTAAVSVPASRTLGSFCVEEPTATTVLALTATGTGSVELDAPAVQGGAASAFLVEPGSPSAYPFKLPAKQSVTVAVTPLRQSVAGPQSDTIVWPTDLAGSAAPVTAIAADFISDGGAIAPNSVDYGAVPIHVSTANEQSITVQNCGSADMMLDPPQISPAGPFHITGAPPPTRLAPTQSSSFAIEFAPLQTGTFDSNLVLSTTKGPLNVSLHGEGVVQGSGSSMPGDDDGEGGGGCGGCTSGDAPSGTSAAFAGGMCVVVLRRRRRRAPVES